MNWKRDLTGKVIKHHSEALKGIIAALFAMLGLDGEATVSRIPKPLHRAVALVLRPAESALRRLIVIAARGLVVKVAPSRPMAKGQSSGKARDAGSPPSSSTTHGNTSRNCSAPGKIHQVSAPHPFLRARFQGPTACGLHARPKSAAPPDGLVNGEGPQPEAPGSQARSR